MATRDVGSHKPHEADNAARNGSQPSAASEPRHFAVICEAGCSSEVPGIVDLTPRKQPAVNTAMGTRPTGAASEAVCIGGCYADAGPAVASAVEAASGATNWMATATGSGKPVHGADQPPASTSGRWYDRIGNSGAR